MAPAKTWADLPIELLDLILQKMFIFPDHIRFRAVCKNWYFAALLHWQNRNKPMLPLLMPDLKLYCWEGKIYSYQFLVTPSHRGRGRFLGSSHGWLALREPDFSVTLLKPFSHKTIRLPPIVDGKDVYIQKVSLSCDPSLHPDDYFVAAIFSFTESSAAFMKSGELSWTCLQNEERFRIFDICFFKGQLYLYVDIGPGPDYQLIDVDSNGRLTSITVPLVLNAALPDYQPVGPYVVESPEEEVMVFPNSSSFRRLVESPEGDLLLVWHISYSFRSDLFMVLKLVKDSGKEKAEFVEMESLGNCILFMSSLDCFCISATNVPNCRENCIYYVDVCTDNLDRRRGRVFCFDMRSKQIVRCGDVPDFALEFEFKSPFWISPTLI